MARRKPLDKYPKEYFELFRHASERTITVVHETIAQAEATRNELYTFRSVLYHSHDQQDLARLAQNVRLSITGSTLTAEPILQLNIGDPNDGHKEE